LNPIKVLQTLDNLLPNNAVLVVDGRAQQNYLCWGHTTSDPDLSEGVNNDMYLFFTGGDFVGSAAYILRPRSALSWLDPGPFGTLGCGWDQVFLYQILLYFPFIGKSILYQLGLPRNFGRRSRHFSHFAEASVSVNL
jgi:hypothetical protein